MKSIYIIPVLAMFYIGLIQHSYAQNEYPITISLDGTSFFPSVFKDNGDIESRQIDILIAYQNKDEDLINTRINALLVVYDSEGDKIDEITYKDGFEITTDGFFKFTNTVDSSVENATIDLHLTDFDMEEQLSNELKVDVSASNPIVSY
jgi:hypothetical protein